MGRLVPASFGELLPAVNQASKQAKGLTSQAGAFANKAKGFGNQGLDAAKQVKNVAGEGGKPLPPDLKHRLEAKLNQNLSDVRVFEDHRPTLAGAMAYAQGPNVFFAPGQYHPHSQEGFDLLSHELAHVVQQRGGLGGRSVPNGLAEVLELADLGANR